MATSNWVNPGMLKWARDRLGLSFENVEVLSKKLGKSYSSIQGVVLQGWEAGTFTPDLEYLETLAEIYICPVGYFFLSHPPREVRELSYRGLSAGKEEKLGWQSRQALQRFRELIEWAVFLIKGHDTAWRANIQPFRRVAYDIKLVQRERERLGFKPEVRKKWRNFNDAFLWWRKQIENQGIFCFQLKLEPKAIRGASRWVESRYPFILVNHQDAEAATGRIFTLLHEYAHLLSVTDEGIVCDFRGVTQPLNPEPLANRFAAQMLISHEELREELKRVDENRYRDVWSDQILGQIRRPFFVSRDVVAITLQEMNLAPSNFYQNRREQWDARKWKTPWGRGGALTKRERKLRELGFSLTKILVEGAKDGPVSPSDLAYFLDMKMEKVDEFLKWSHQAVGSKGT